MSSDPSRPGRLGAVVGQPTVISAAPQGSAANAEVPFDERLAALDRALRARGIVLR